MGGPCYVEARARVRLARSFLQPKKGAKSAPRHESLQVIHER